MNEVGNTSKEKLIQMQDHELEKEREIIQRTPNVD